VSPLNSDLSNGKFPSWGQAFWNEVVMTCFFVSVILAAKYLNGAKDLFLNALVIGLTLFYAIDTGGHLSGGMYNPALGLVQPIFQKMMSEESIPSLQLNILYVFGPLIGGICAGLFKNLNVLAR